MDPRYPIGQFAMPAEVAPAQRQHAIDEIVSSRSSDSQNHQQGNNALHE